MAGFFTKIKSPVASPTTQATKDVGLKKKDEPAVELTPLEKMLLNAGPLRHDGTDKFLGFENFGNTCYCNSIVQALFYSQLFRQSVVNYPTLPPSPSETPSETPNVTHPIVPVTIRPPLRPAPVNPQQKKGGKDAAKSKPGNTVTQTGTSGPSGVRPEDKPDTPEYKKKQAMIKGPILEVASENALSYGMEECTFTGLKDIFLAIQQSSSRTGVLSPQRFLEIFKRDNEMFRNSMHQDAHEFYGVVLNDVIANVESNARRTRERLEAAGEDGPATSVEGALGPSFVHDAGNGYRTPATGWVHDIFEGLLTSETKCLTCETASQRDETFLDLSIDLEQHSSVTSCLRKFSAEEMLCERNKFHCDNCGGLQEAEKRMKVKRLPKILTLHLKRFKYTEDYSRLQKLFHRVVYPYHLRMFNTTDDADDQDRLYELYAVVVHIGGNAYHGHYVSIIKTQDRGWVLFDDEMVEPVDKHFVRNFFGDKPGMATAYVLFYQETTFEKFREEQERESMEEMEAAAAAAQATNPSQADAPLRKLATQPVPATPHLEQEPLDSLAHARTVPGLVDSTPSTPPSEPFLPLPKPLMNGAAVTARPTQTSDEASTGSTPSKAEAKSKDELKREKKEREAADKAARQLEKEREKEREKQSREELKKARDDLLRASQSRRQEQEEFFKALNASKKTAAHEEDVRRKEENGNASSNGAVTSHAMSFLDRSRKGGKSMSRKSFSLFNHKEKQGHHHPPEEAANGDAPEKQDKFKGRLSIGLGRKKSSNVLV